MYIPIYAHIRYLVAFQSDPRESVKIFKILKSFLESEKSGKNFIDTKYGPDPDSDEKEIVLPLTLNESADENLRQRLSDHLNVYQSGQKLPYRGKKEKDPYVTNFIYLIGQYLTILHINFQALDVKDSSFEKFSKELKLIWNGANNAATLAKQYNGKDNKPVISDILKKFDKTIDFLENKFLPAYDEYAKSKSNH